MKKIRTLYVLGVANLECPVEALDWAEESKKSGHGHYFHTITKEKCDADRLEWFQSYEKEHQSIDFTDVFLL